MHFIATFLASRIDEVLNDTVVCYSPRSAPLKSCEIEQCLDVADVCFWHLADINAQAEDVCFRV